VYGEGDRGMSKKKNALQYMIQQLKNNEKVELYENGNIVRDFVHVNDVTKAFDLILSRGNINEIYNVGTGNPVKISELVMTAKNIIGSDSVILNIETPEFHRLVQTKDAWLDIEKIKNLGFTPQADIRVDLECLCL
jgi:dTDP-glucose 4,6-dehydratase